MPRAASARRELQQRKRGQHRAHEAPALALPRAGSWPAVRRNVVEMIFVALQVHGLGLSTVSQTQRATQIANRRRQRRHHLNHTAESSALFLAAAYRTGASRRRIRLSPSRRRADQKPITAALPPATSTIARAAPPLGERQSLRVIRVRNGISVIEREAQNVKHGLQISSPVAASACHRGAPHLVARHEHNAGTAPQHDGRDLSETESPPNAMRPRHAVENLRDWPSALTQT